MDVRLYGALEQFGLVHVQWVVFVFHAIDGHRLSVAGEDFDAALSTTREECIFTTHTPVPAGHDRFHPGLMSYALNRYEQHLNLSHKDLMALGRLNADDEDETFCMTVLALNTARRVRAGVVWINDSQPAPSESLWGGYKQSGVGRELGPYALDAYLETKQIYVNLGG